MAGSDTSSASWKEILVPRYAAPLALVSMGVWLHAADELLIATMMPAMIREIGGADLVAWTFALYEIGSILAGAASGLLALQFGINRPMALAALLFSLGCVFAALAPTMPVVLLGRLMQGIGGGGLVALSFVAVGILFPPRLAARAMASMSALWGVSAFLGPLIGGLFVEYGTWRGGFWFFAVQAVALAVWIATALGAGNQKRPTEEATDGFPLVRLSILCAGVVAIAYGGIDVAPVSTTLFILAGLACIGVFLILDMRKGDARLMPRAAIQPFSALGAALVMIMFMSMGTIALSLYGPILLTGLHGTNALVAGYIIACSSFGWTLAAIAVSGAPERRDPLFIGLGMTIVTLGVALSFFAIREGPIWLIAVAAALEGAGFGMAWTFILRRGIAIAPPQDSERLSASLPTVQRLGYALGAAAIGIVANATGLDNITDTGALSEGAGAIFAISLVFALVGLMAAMRFAAEKVR